MTMTVTTKKPTARRTRKPKDVVKPCPKPVIDAKSVAIIGTGKPGLADELDTKITVHEFVRLVVENGSKMISLKTMTRSKLLRKSRSGEINPYPKDEVIHIAVRTCNPLTNYAKALMKMQPSVSPSKPRNNIRRLGASAFCRHHKGRNYISACNWKMPYSVYTYMGKEIDFETIKQFLPKKDHTRPDFCTVALGNVVGCTIEGTSYMVGDRVPQPAATAGN